MGALVVVTKSMSVRKIRDRWWVDFRYRFTRYRRKSPLNTAEGAKQYQATLLARLARGEPVDPPKPAPAVTFAEFAAEWFETYVKVNNKPSEQRNKRQMLEGHILPALGLRDISSITMSDIEQYKASKQKTGLSNKTINNQLAVVGKCLRSAQDWDILPTVPRVRLLKAAPPRVEVLTDEECARLLADRTEPTWVTMVLVALRTGLRLSELIGLDWKNVDLDRGYILVTQGIVRGIVGTPKNGRTRSVPIDDEVCAALRGLGPRRSGLIVAREDGSPVSYHIAERALHRMCDRAGIRRCGWHRLRHTFGTQLYQERTPIRDVQTLLGHSSLAMTERYTHVASQSLVDAVARLASRQRFPSALGQPVGTEAPVHLPLPPLAHAELR